MQGMNEIQENGRTELFTYDITVDGEVIITGLTETALQDKKNRRIVIPEEINGLSVVRIGEGAFANLPLTEVTLPNDLLEIGRGGFYGCNLETIWIPMSVSYIAPRAFGANYGMTGIMVEEENPYYTSAEGVLYDKGKTVVVQVPANYNAEELVLPETISTIGEYAFGNNKTLRTVYVKEKDAVVTHEKAFWNTKAELVEDRYRYKRVDGHKSGEMYYPLRDFKEVESYGLNYKVNDNGSIAIRYDSVYAQLTLECPALIDLQYCTEIMMKYQSLAGDFGIRFYDEESEEIMTWYQGKSTGVEETCYPNRIPAAKVAKIGFMSSDESLENYDLFELIVYSLQFQFINKEANMITYNFKDLVHERHEDLSYEVWENGSIQMKFHDIYQEIIFALPEKLDMKKCYLMHLNVKSEYGSIGLHLYDENPTEDGAVDVFYGCKTVGVQNKMYVPTWRSGITRIAFMSNDHEVTDYSEFDVTINSVTFYMKE